MFLLLKAVNMCFIEHLVAELQWSMPAIVLIINNFFNPKL